MLRFIKRCIPVLTVNDSFIIMRGLYSELVNAINEELKMQSISHFPNDASDALMMVHLKRDGLLWRTETGSTPLSKD